MFEPNWTYEELAKHCLSQLASITVIKDFMGKFPHRKEILSQVDKLSKLIKKDLERNRS